MRYVIVLIIVVVTMETAILLVKILQTFKRKLGKIKWYLKITLILTTASLYLCMVPLISCQLLKFWQVMQASTILAGTIGYSLTPNHQINLLQYADDMCLVANGPAACQHLFDTTSEWLQWSGMRAEVPKCHSLAIHSSSSRLVDPQLTVNGQPIPFIGNNSIKFLGMRVDRSAT